MQPLAGRRIARIGLAGLALLLIVWWVAPRTDSARAPRHAIAAEPTPLSGPSVHRDEPRAKSRVATLAPAGEYADEPPTDPRVQRCQDELQAAMKARAATLAKSDAARDRAAALLFNFTTSVGTNSDPARVSKRFTALAEANPDDRLLAWLAAEHCGYGQACERAALDRVLRLDGDNMAAWLFAVERALARNDEIAADALLRRAAAAPRLQVFWREQGLLALDAMSGLQVPSCEAAREAMGRALGVDVPLGTDGMVSVFAMASATAVTLSLGTTRLCPDSGSIPAARWPACRAVFSRLAEGDELISRTLGIARMRAWARTPAERAAWKERQRELLWLQQERAKLRAADIRMMLEYGEVPFLRALLEEQGRWPVPAGWLPENPFLRERLEALP